MTNGVAGEMQNPEFGYASHSANLILQRDCQALQKPVRFEPAGRLRHERWPMRERARIVAESFAPGVTLTAIARANGVSLGLLHYWRRKARDIGHVEEMRQPAVEGEGPDASEGFGAAARARDDG